MEKINSCRELQEAISMLQQKKEQQKAAIGIEMEKFHQSLRPATIFKSTLKNFVDGNNITSSAATSVLGLGSGMIAKKLVTGKSRNILKRMLGGIIQIAVTGLVAKNSDKIASKSLDVGKKVFS